MSMISLDSHRPIMCSLARRAITNICLMYASKNVNMAQIAATLINHQMKSSNYNEITERFNVADMSLANSAAASSFHTHNSQNINESASTGVDTSILSANMPQNDYRKMLLFSNEIFGSPGELILAIVDCLSHRPEGMWPHEEANSRCWKIESAEQLGCLTRHIAEYMLESEPNLAKIWTAVAMNMALSTSNRHLAGRSFQVAGALCQNPAPFINRVLSRLSRWLGKETRVKRLRSISLT
uniref:Uncharacterized protein n=1 Tax=Ditylenchus dipsaci TaxID=166011 RepID=A0A915EW70_9BILA